MTNDFYTKGYQIFDGRHLAKQIPIDDIIWQREDFEDGDNHPANDLEVIDLLLKSIHQQIALEFVSPYYSDYSIDKRRIWEGVNNGATAWHNDLNEGPNCFFLLYFTDLTQLKQGAIHFKTSDTSIEWSHYPTVGMLVAVNCAETMLHRADQTDHKRVIASFCFNINHNSYKDAT